MKKEELPLISVIVPIYNVKDYLDKCMKSLLDQTYENLEIIMVDDGSTDGSAEIADSYKKYKNVRTIHQKNGGLSNARNTGIKNASGEWLAFVDSDDYVEKDFVSILYSIAIKNDADIATCSLKTFSKDGSPLKKEPSWPTGTLSGFEAVNDTMKNKRPAYICLNLFRANLFKKNKILFPDGKEYEDIATKTKLLFCARKVAFTNRQLYHYLIRKSSITGKDFSDIRYQDFMSALKEVRDYLNKTSIKFEYVDYFEFYSLVTLLNYLAREEKKTVIKKKYWTRIRRQLKELYPQVKFPSMKKKLIGKAVIILSTSKGLYSMIYRMTKK